MRAVLQAIQILLVLFVSELLLAAALVFARSIYPSSTLDFLMQSRLTGLVPYAATILFARRLKSCPHSDPLRRSPRPTELLALCLLAAFCSAAYVLAYYALTDHSAPTNLDAVAGSTLYFQLEGLGVEIVAAPLLEETLFRGVVLANLLVSMNRIFAVLLSAAAFSLVHVDLQAVAGAMFFGVLAGCVFIRTSRVLPCVLVHSVWNCTISVLAAIR